MVMLLMLLMFMLVLVSVMMLSIVTGRYVCWMCRCYVWCYRCPYASHVVMLLFFCAVDVVVVGCGRGGWRC